MTDDKSETVAWWTVDGWMRRPAPAQYQAYLIAEGDRESHGYREVAQFGNTEDGTPFEIQIFSVADDEHWNVEIWTSFCPLSSFFVHRVEQDAFVVDKLGGLLRDYNLADYPSELLKIRTSLVAFIRHGHGKSTIDEDGLVTRDMAEFQEAVRRSQAARAARAAKP